MNFFKIFILSIFVLFVFSCKQKTSNISTNKVLQNEELLKGEGSFQENNDVWGENAFQQQIDNFHTSAGRVMDKLVFKNTNIIDVVESKLLSNMSIIVKDEKITHILKTLDLTQEHLNDAKVIDVKGTYVTPSLIESHSHYVHTYSEKSSGENSKFLMKRKIYSGITAIRDMWGDGRAAANFSRQTYMNEFDAPDYYYAAFFAGPEEVDSIAGYDNIFAGHRSVSTPTPWAQTIDENTDIKVAVAMARGTGATGIKIYGSISGEIIKKIIAEAKKQGILVWSHSHVYPSSPFHVLGGKTVSHTSEIVKYVLTNGSNDFDAESEKPYTKVTVKEIIEHPLFKKYVNALKTNQTIFEPTMNLSDLKANGSEDYFSGITVPRELVAGVINALYKAEVKLLAGSDSFADEQDDFPKLYKELIMFVEEAKLPTTIALQTATINAAESLGLLNEFGTIEVGKYANLAFFKKNPIENIHHLKTIMLTVKRGKQFFRKDFK